MRPLAVPLPVGARLENAPAVYGGKDSVASLQQLASALASSAAWPAIAGEAAFIVRGGPAPVLALVGQVDEVQDAVVRALDWQVGDCLDRLIPFGWSQVSEACGRLADRLRERVGEGALARCVVVPIPRGGLVVAGLLSYCLGLRPDQLRQVLPDDHDGPVVVVDDCMISGARTRRWLRENSGPRVVLAHLHSHPDLRSSAERDERVVACLAAENLVDHAPARQGEEYNGWRERWRERSPDDYWTGHPDHVVYPWNEPDTLVWDDVADRAVAGWHVVPPSWCLKNRPGPPGSVQVLPERAGGGAVPPEVLWVELPDKVVIVDTRSDAAVALTGTAADFWRALVRTDDVATVASTVARDYAAPPDRVAADVRNFVEALARQGYWRPPPDDLSTTPSPELAWRSSA